MEVLSTHKKGSNQMVMTGRNLCCNNDIHYVTVRHLLTFCKESTIVSQCMALIRTDMHEVWWDPTKLILVGTTIIQISVICELNVGTPNYNFQDVSKFFNDGVHIYSPLAAILKLEKNKSFYLHTKVPYHIALKKDSGIFLCDIKLLYNLY